MISGCLQRPRGRCLRPAIRPSPPALNLSPRRPYPPLCVKAPQDWRTPRRSRNVGSHRETRQRLGPQSSSTAFRSCGVSETPGFIPRLSSATRKRQRTAALQNLTDFPAASASAKRLELRSFSTAFRTRGKGAIVQGHHSFLRPRSESAPDGSGAHYKSWRSFHGLSTRDSSWTAVVLRQAEIVGIICRLPSINSETIVLANCNFV